MRVEWFEIAGVSLTPSTLFADSRGTFTKLYGRSDESDPSIKINQVAVSRSVQMGTVRGLHFQVAPHQEHKRLWCGEGSIWDVLVDVRPDYATYGHWAAMYLSDQTSELLTVPPGVAHGYQTLTTSSSVVYLIDGSHAPESARTLAWDDPHLAIEWPRPPSIISTADQNGSSWPVC